MIWKTRSIVSTHPTWADLDQPLTRISLLESKIAALEEYFSLVYKAPPTPTYVGSMGQYKKIKE